MIHYGVDHDLPYEECLEQCEETEVCICEDIYFRILDSEYENQSDNSREV